MNAIGITGRAHEWFHDYLLNRTQYIQVDGLKSTTISVDDGIPQGNNLASTLFTIHINNLANINMNGTPYQFADDVALLNVHENKINLQNTTNSDMQLLYDWMNKQKLALNVKKTKYMIFSSDPKDEIDIYYNGTKIEKVLQYKYLGLHLDAPKLSWELHLQHLKRRLSTIAGIFWRLGKLCPRRVLKQIYHSMFQSLVIYGIGIWGTATKQLLSQLQIIQNRAIRNLFREDRRISIKELHEKHNLLKIEDLINIALTTHIHNISNNFIHSTTTLVTNSEVHNYQTRNTNQIRIRQSHTSRNGINGLLNKSILAYQNIPPSIKALPRQQFKNEIKKFFMNRRQ